MVRVCFYLRSDFFAKAHCVSIFSYVVEKCIEKEGR